MLPFLVFVSVLAVILSRPPIVKALLGLLRDRKELVLFALFLLVEIVLVAVILMVFGPREGFYVLIASVALFAVWATRPPAKRR